MTEKIFYSKIIVTHNGGKDAQKLQSLHLQLQLHVHQLNHTLRTFLL